MVIWFLYSHQYQTKTLSPRIDLFWIRPQEVLKTFGATIYEVGLAPGYPQVSWDFFQWGSNLTPNVESFFRGYIRWSRGEVVGNSDFQRPKDLMWSSVPIFTPIHYKWSQMTFGICIFYKIFENHSLIQNFWKMLFQSNCISGHKFLIFQCVKF